MLGKLRQGFLDVVLESGYPILHGSGGSRSKKMKFSLKYVVTFRGVKIYIRIRTNTYEYIKIRKNTVSRGGRSGGVLGLGGYFWKIRIFSPFYLF